MWLFLQPFSSGLPRFKYVLFFSSFHINQISKVIYPRKKKQKLYINYLISEWLSIWNEEVKPSVTKPVYIKCC